MTNRFPKTHRFLRMSLCFLMLFVPVSAIAQSMGSLRGQVLDPSGAAVPDASVTLTQGTTTQSAHSGADGSYSFKSLPSGTYTIDVQASGFAAFSRTDLVIAPGQTRQQNVSLTIAIQQQDITVNDQSAGVSLNPDENASALVVKGSDLDALSDDPDELQNELQALSGPSAGPSGGQIYIDGFSGGQIPPKSSIREIRVNQNPFSAEFDKIGYGRIEILTKPGSDKFSGHVTSLGNDSAWNTGNPLVSQQPSYYLWFLQGDVNGPLSKNASYFFSIFHMDRQNQSIINAVDPDDPTNSFNQALPNPSSLLFVNPRVDVQLGKSNTLSVRDSYFRSLATANGPGELSLPEQAYDVNNQENAIQLSDTVVVSPRVLNETHFQWRRIRNSQVASFFTPTVTVQGAFTTGGNNSGIVRDHQDLLELQNYSTATAGSHTIRFGVRLRTYRDANYSTSGENGDYLFTSIDQYVAQTPVQYQATVIQNPLARALLFDGALFYQDDWRVNPNLTFSYGLRFETQNRIHDHADWGPRLSFAWAPFHTSKTPPKTVVRGGYGWFFDRFTVPTSFFSSGGAPYIMQAIHQNGVNQQSYVINDPDFYNPNAPAPPNTFGGTTTSIPSVYNIDRHFHAALSMQGGIGVDQQIGKKVMLNATYLFTRGVHQYLTNNVTAPDFDPATYTIVGPPPSEYSYQFQSGGIYKQNQIIVNGNVQLKHLSLHGNYTFNQAKSDTQGVTYVPSVAHDPGLDYGRAGFGYTNRVFLIGTYAAPYRITFAPLLAAQSGTPYNLVTGSDFTGNNQFNARPTFGACGAPGVISTTYGCLDSDPTGKGEAIVPYGYGTGPANFVMHMRVSKVIGIGPRIEGSKGPGGMGGGNGNVSGRGLSGGQAQPKFDASVPRRYSLTLAGGALNIFNIVNLGTPNGTLSSPLFGKTQSLASGPFGSPTPGNRTVFVQATFTF
jgi:Carboxypeptidase regulatory-like domain